MTRQLTTNQVKAMLRRVASLASRPTKPVPVETPIRLGEHVQLQPRPVQVRQPIGRFKGDLERHKTKRAGGSRARVAIRRKTDA